MQARDHDDCAAGACRDSILELVLAGQAPNERQVEMLLDRLGHERPEDTPAGATR